MLVLRVTDGTMDGWMDGDIYGYGWCVMLGMKSFGTGTHTFQFPMYIQKGKEGKQQTNQPTHPPNRKHFPPPQV